MLTICKQRINKHIHFKHPNTTNKMTGLELRSRPLALVVGVATLLLVVTGVAYNNGNSDDSNLQMPGAMPNSQVEFTASSDPSRSLQEAEISAIDGHARVRGSERILKGKGSSSKSAKSGKKGKKGKKSKGEETAMPSAAGTEMPTATPQPTNSPMPSSDPSSAPSISPSGAPTVSAPPSATPSTLPSGSPTVSAAPSASAAPTVTESMQPTAGSSKKGKKGSSSKSGKKSGKKRFLRESMPEAESSFKTGKRLA
jgi:hypothetical protein